MRTVTEERLPKEHIFVFFHQEGHQHTADPCGEDLTDADRQAKEPPCVGNMIGILQDEGDDEDVGKDGRDGEQEADAAQRESAQCIGAERAQQGGKRAEEDVKNDTSGQQIGQHASDGKSGDGGESHEEGENAERLGQAALNGARGKSHGGREIGQHNVRSRYHSGQDGIADGFITGMETVHDSKQRPAGRKPLPRIFLLLSFLLSEDGCELTIMILDDKILRLRCAPLRMTGGGVRMAANLLWRDPSIPLGMTGGVVRMAANLLW